MKRAANSFGPVPATFVHALPRTYTNSVYEQRNWLVVRQAHHERGKGLPFAVRPEQPTPRGALRGRKELASAESPPGVI
jgi:hypothetical protein